MKIIIGNHIDPAIRERRDMRTWTQRALWFAAPGDVVVLCSAPDPDFTRYALAHTGVDASQVTVLVAPPGRYGGALMDPAALTAPSLLDELHAAIGDLERVTEIFALWPCAGVARLADALDLASRFPGAAFFAQGGGEIGNNKANFRALAAAAGVPIPPGSVCRSRGDAIEMTARHLEASPAGAVVVKQAHNGAGVGNELLVTDPAMSTGHVGARHLHRLADGPAGIEAYWRQRWDWASGGGRFPVVVEEFAPGAAAVYSEHYADDDGVRPTEMGRLVYFGRRLNHQIVPLDDVDEQLRARLLDYGTRLAEAYHAIGHRGHLSADALALPDGRVVCTEVNAQVSGSLHIYQAIAHGVVDIAARPRRQVVEYHVPSTWHVPNLAAFLAAADEEGLGYDPVTRTGVIVSMPAVPVEPCGPAQFVFCIAYDPAVGHVPMFQRLDRRFTAVPAVAYDASDHVGVHNRAATAWFSS